MDSPLVHFIKKEFIQLFRDPRMLYMALFMPIIQLLVFGYIASTDLRNVSMVVLDEDMSTSSRAYLQSFKSSGRFKIDNYVSDDKQVADVIDGGRATLALHIPPRFEKDLLAGRSTNVQAIVDGSNASNAVIVLGYINQINFINSNNHLLKRLSKLGLGSNERTLFDIEMRIWYNPELKSINFMVPAVFAQILMLMGMILTSFAIVKEKEKGTIEQLIVTPLKPYELILGKLIPSVIVALVDVILSFVVAVFWFRVPIHGSIILLFLCCAIFLTTGLGLGIFISTISKSQRQAIMTTVFLLSPMFILSGFVFPISSMPAIIQGITFLIPLRYFLVIVRGIFIKGIGIRYLWHQILPLIIFGVVILTLSIRRFRKKMD